MSLPKIERRRVLSFLLKDSMRSSWPIPASGIAFLLIVSGDVFIEDIPYGPAGIMLFVSLLYVCTFWSSRQNLRKTLYSSLPIGAVMIERLSWVESFLVIPGGLFLCQMALLVVRSFRYGFEWPYFYFTFFLFLLSLGIMAALWIISDGPAAQIKGWRLFLHAGVLLGGLFLEAALVSRRPDSPPLSHLIMNPLVAIPLALTALGLLAVSFFHMRMPRRRSRSTSREPRKPAMAKSIFRIPDLPLLRFLSVQDMVELLSYFASLGIVCVILAAGRENVAEVIRHGLSFDDMLMFLMPVIVSLPDDNSMQYFRVLPITAARFAAVNFLLRGALALLAAVPVVFLAQWAVPERVSISYIFPFLSGVFIASLGIGLLTFFIEYAPITHVLYGGLIGVISIRFGVVKNSFSEERISLFSHLESNPHAWLLLLVMVLAAIVIGYWLMKRGIQNLHPRGSAVNIEERFLGMKIRSSHP